MSIIIAKPFTKAQKILKAVFQGPPNLFTVPDLNRQIDIMKNQMDVTGDLVAVVSDFVPNVAITKVRQSATLFGNAIFEGGYVIANKNSIALTGVTYSGTFVEHRGVLFSITGLPIQGTLTGTLTHTDKRYLTLYATKTLVTFATDPTKEISGAKFADDTAMAAANHYVYSGETIVFDATSADTYNGKEKICVLAEVSFKERKNMEGVALASANAIVSNYCIGRGTTVYEAAKNSIIKNLDSAKGVSDILREGMTIEQALSYLGAEISNLKDSFGALTNLSLGFSDAFTAPLTAQNINIAWTTKEVWYRLLQVGNICIIKGSVILANTGSMLLTDVVQLNFALPGIKGDLLYSFELELGATGRVSIGVVLVKTSGSTEYDENMRATDPIGAPTLGEIYQVPAGVPTLKFSLPTYQNAVTGYTRVSSFTAVLFTTQTSINFDNQ